MRIMTRKRAEEEIRAIFVESWAEGIIKALEQKPKTGHWIFVEGIKGKDNVEKCSCCGSHWREAIIYRTDTQEYLRTRLLYCPNCGSRNEVEE